MWNIVSSRTSSYYESFDPESYCREKCNEYKSFQMYIQCDDCITGCMKELFGESEWEVVPTPAISTIKAITTGDHTRTNIAETKTTTNGFNIATIASTTTTITSSTSTSFASATSTTTFSTRGNRTLNIFLELSNIWIQANIRTSNILMFKK